MLSHFWRIESLSSADGLCSFAASRGRFGIYIIPTITLLSFKVSGIIKGQSKSYKRYFMTLADNKYKWWWSLRMREEDLYI